MSEKLLGTSILSTEDLPLLRGQAEYIDDVYQPGVLFAKIVRSPHPHALIKSIRATNGTKIFTSDDIADYHHELRLGAATVKHLPFRVLASKKVRYVGEPVAVLLAESRRAAEDALEHVEVDYEPLPSVTNVSESIKNQNIINDEWDTNLALHLKLESGDISRARNEADVVLEETFQIHRVIAAPLETRGVISHYNQASKTLTVWESTQSPHQERSILSQCLGIDENRIRIISTRCGGGFGSKSPPPYPEYLLIPILSIITNKPVKWIEDRTESFMAMSHAREQMHSIKIYSKNDGRIVGIEDKVLADMGAYPTRSGPNEAFGAGLLLPGCYNIENLNIEVQGLATNKTPIGPYRGFGKTSPNFVIERAVDILAKRLNVGITEIRFKNFVKSFPYTSGTGIRYDSGDYDALLNKAMTVMDYGRLKEEIARLRRSGVYRGVGIACAINPSGGTIKDTMTSPYDAVNIKICKDGSIMVSTGSCGLIGTGHHASFAQVVAEVLGADFNRILVVEGDTSTCPIGQGSYSDRSAVYTISAAYGAAKLLKEKVLDIASHILKAPKSHLEIKNHQVQVRGNSSASLSFSELARIVYNSPYSLPTELSDLDVTHYFRIGNVSFANDGVIFFPCIGSACHACYVEVDKDTGAVNILKYVIVDDCGLVVNPAIVNGQLSGGIVQGVSGAILEELNYDESGQLTTLSFMDYLMATPSESFEIEVESLESRSDMTLLGTKGVGESGIIGSYAAVANAVEDALKPFSAKITKLPLKPEYVLSLIKRKS